jgi:hypothetical protein
MDGCFENRITASDDVSSHQMGRDIGLDTNTDELATVDETLVFSRGHFKKGKSMNAKDLWRRF